MVFLLASLKPTSQRVPQHSFFTCFVPWLGPPTGPVLFGQEILPVLVANGKIPLREEEDVLAGKDKLI